MAKDIYTFADGTTQEYDHIIFPNLDGEADETMQIKVNIPDCEEAYKSGNGEGIWMLVSPETREKVLADYKSKPGEVFFGRLLNHSVYCYGMLMWGMIVPFEMRGHQRPVVLWNDIRYKHWGSDQKELEKNLEKIEAKNKIKSIFGKPE